MNLIIGYLRDRIYKPCCACVV